ncbi:thiamine phosphate synthase [Vogesella indigofera]|uniref:Thiamine-phosphate synthase n=1 Tax=Vogesella indigofera TaxID=45465 RepID=A0ABT5I3A7_VOGIN|nr:thiamine phosphate synthase [Vogesella indigofera]MDC7690663.1 thiamine phosphate synthase [Vogesella indigofera]
MHNSTRQPSRPAWLDGLYAVTPDTSDSAWLLPRVAAVLDGGASLVQYRNKSRDTALRREQATAIQALCRQHGAGFIVNDDMELAAELGADGVHLGQSDTSLCVARQRLGPHAVIGATCHDQPALAMQAVANGASYVAFGALFPSRSKPEVVSAPLSLFASLPPLAVPCVAIGGITAANAALAWRTGVDMLAVIGGLFDAPAPDEAARVILAARG